MTERLFHLDQGRRETTARVVAVSQSGVVLDRTVFYARSGGQPGDTGVLTWPGGSARVTDAVKGDGELILHVTDGPTPEPGAEVTATLDWPRRHAIMRMHTALHLLCSLLPGAGVTGGQIGPDRSRLDLDLPASPDKERLDDGFAALIEANHPVSTEWVDWSLLDDNPSLVRTLSVQPPRGTGPLRLVRIGDAPIDLQPCGGTHVAATGEIGAVTVGKIENKGRQNRRISLVLG